MKYFKLLALATITTISLTACTGTRTTPCCDSLKKELKPVVHFAFNSAGLTSKDKHILQMIPLIDNVHVTKNLNEIHDSVSKIIKTIEKDPKKEKFLKNFFDYYLPVTVKLVDRFDYKNRETRDKMNEIRTIINSYVESRIK